MLTRALAQTVVAPIAAAAVVLTTGGVAQAATITVQDSHRDVRLSDDATYDDVHYQVYWRSDIENASVSAGRTETAVTWNLYDDSDDLSAGTFERVAKLRVTARVSPKSKKTTVTKFEAAYVAGAEDPVTLTRVTSAGRTPVACTDLYYEADGNDFTISAANSCLGKRLTSVAVTLETHSVDRGSSITLFDTVATRPAAY